MRVMFYFDKDSFEAAVNEIKNYDIDANSFTTSKSYGLVSKKDGKEWISYIAPNCVHNKVRNIDWGSLGIKGFEEVEVTKITEFDVVLTPIAIVENL